MGKFATLVQTGVDKFTLLPRNLYLPPILYLQAFDSGEFFHIGRHQQKPQSPGMACEQGVIGTDLFAARFQFHPNPGGLFRSFLIPGTHHQSGTQQAYLL